MGEIRDKKEKEQLKMNKQENGAWVDVCDQCLECEIYWKNNDTDSECEGEEEPCHEFRQCKHLKEERG